ncbi:MAG TPA: crossover junction endodeoxyribonuclease RuvC, partial [candidate division Zixibacteria bacterium]|nr:crossover junction endodeoxyribonuclease RuvC [candidate division Zixibacteria bacterium]
MRVLGIDPGLQITGYGVIEDGGGAPVVLEAGVIRTTSGHDMSLRLHELSCEIKGVIEQFRPDIIAVEELYSHYGHPRTAII